MGCVSSKKARSQSPSYDDFVIFCSKNGRSRSRSRSRSSSRSRSRPPSSSGSFLSQSSLGPLEKINEDPEPEPVENDDQSNKTRLDGFQDHSENLRVLQKEASEKRVDFTINFGRLTEAEHLSNGWPAWLSSVAAEAVDGWIPLRSDAFERYEKIGQGTYSNVYRARHLETGKMVALKKVRFDNFHPESVRFMAREIMILRKLDHPNIMKLEGIITSRLSCTIYLVFEYMEHDFSGLLSCPDFKFTDSQIKCYMRQLLSGIEHCHAHGIMHRDIKTSNILVNNEGILKIADFGLGNFLRPMNKEPLTSRVVTLWYRPPELLLGSTNYGESVDMWSVGCVFAEFFIGRPLLKGRTEVEQLHKIFKLCGSPPDEYWKRSKLPLASMFKPKQPYESSLRERCKEFPKSAVSLIETLLSIEPYKRGSASSALASEYFNTKPYACDPSCLPKYPPNKEIDAKLREEARRKAASATAARVQSVSKNPRRIRRPLHETRDFSKLVSAEEVEANNQLARRNNHVASANANRRRGGIESRTSLKQPFDTKSDASHMTQESQATSVQSVPVQTTASTNFSWATKRPKQNDVFTRLHGHSNNSRIQKPNKLEPSISFDSYVLENNDTWGRVHGVEASKHREHVQLNRPDSFDSSDNFESQESVSFDNKKKKGKTAFSGPLLHESQETISRHHKPRNYEG